MARTRLVEQLDPHVARAYSEVSDGGEATLGYRSSLVTLTEDDAASTDGPSAVIGGTNAPGPAIPHLDMPWRKDLRPGCWRRWADCGRRRSSGV